MHTVLCLSRGEEKEAVIPDQFCAKPEKFLSRDTGKLHFLGQNVNSYRWSSGKSDPEIDFADLMQMVAQKYPLMRIRFSTSHPKDLSDKLLHIMASFPNICKNIHLPLQSGSTRVLGNMKRKYTREAYLDRIHAIRSIIPEASISTDIIAGFCGETEEDHQDTLSLMNEVGFDFAFMFKYSERPGTLAAKKLKDDVPEEIKATRLNDIIKLQNQLSLESKKKDLGMIYEVLVEGCSKKSDQYLMGRTSQNKVAVFPAGNFKPGEYIKIRVIKVSSATLIAEPVN